MKILILASNPRKDLNLDREIRDLKDVIEKSGNRQRFEVQDALAVRVGDLQDLLFRHRPQIVHFCGHGSGRQGLVFESNDGGEQWVRAEALSDLFRLFAQNVGCVLLNACYSEEQANAIVNHIDYVIGMSREIQDNAAIAFSKGFYRALGYECSMEQAFEFGRNAIQLEISGSSRMRSVATDELRKAEVVGAIEQIEIPEHLKPILKTKPTRAPGARANITAPEQPLSQETRVAIQLDIDRSLEADAKVKQYRDRVREFLNDRKLTKFEKIRLEQLRKSLGLSEEKARQILTEEEAPLQKARDEYEEMLVRLIEEGHYPFNLEIEQELQQLRQELQLTDLEVEGVAQPILQAAEKDHQERLKQQRKAYEDKLQRYRQEFCRAVQVEYPPSQHVLSGLKNFQRQLGLRDEDVAQIEQSIREPLEAKYQEQLRQQELARKQQQEAEYQQKLKSYQEELNRTIELTDYPLSAAALKYLKDYHQSLKLQVEDVERISKPILEQAEAKHRNKLKQQAEAERKRQVEQEKLQKAEYENKLQRYEQEISQIVQREYPLSSTAQANLQKLQNSLGLNQQDTAAINQRILRDAEARYQSRKEAEQQRKQREEAERKRQVEMEQMRQKEEAKRQLEQERQRQEKEHRKQEEAKQRSPLKLFEFQVPTVIIRGETIDVNYRGEQAEYFVEDLGNGVTLEMVAIPGGTFTMGSPADELERSDSEGPQHTVTIQPFYMGKFAVTQAQWRAIAALPKVNRELNPDPSYFKGNNRPVEQISWFEAVEFCERLNRFVEGRNSRKIGTSYRLPSEAEWEYACRAGTATPFHFGETITTDLANYEGNCTYGSGKEGEYRKQTTDVGSFPPNAFGLYDMHGNVWEWCADYWHDNYDRAPVDGTVWNKGRDKKHRQLRGGSWLFNPRNCRSAYRFHFDPVDLNYNLGFRVVCVLA